MIPGKMLAPPPVKLAPPPRKVRWIAQGPWLLWLVRLVTLPFVLVGLFFVAVWIVGPFWAIYGDNHTAQVVHAEKSGSGKKADRDGTAPPQQVVAERLLRGRGRCLRITPRPVVAEDGDHWSPLYTT